MNRNSRRLRRLILPFSVLVLSGSLLAAPARQDNQPAPDNTRVNKDQAPPTADQQQMNSSDRDTTQQIRKAIHDDDSLSSYAHNIKIITQDGKVTLRGPVRSEDEKRNVEAKAVSVAGRDNVTDQLEVTPSSK
ncbi:MAG TPA: BON domain-containing protein [Candidatus Acidoferrales bacterium]